MQRSATRLLPRRWPLQAIPRLATTGIVKMTNPFDIFRPQVAALIGLLFILVIFVTMVYGPIAAMLVELFPDQDPLHLDVAALSHRQRLVRRIVARYRVRDRGLNRRYLRGSLVSNHLRVDHRGRRLSSFLPETKDVDIN